MVSTSVHYTVNKRCENKTWNLLKVPFVKQGFILEQLNNYVERGKCYEGRLGIPKLKFRKIGANSL